METALSPATTIAEGGRRAEKSGVGERENRVDGGAETTVVGERRLGEGGGRRGLCERIAKVVVREESKTTIGRCIIGDGK